MFIGYYGVWAHPFGDGVEDRVEKDRKTQEEEKKEIRCPAEHTCVGVGMGVAEWTLL